MDTENVAIGLVIKPSCAGSAYNDVKVWFVRARRNEAGRRSDLLFSGIQGASRLGVQVAFMSMLSSLSRLPACCLLSDPSFDDNKTFPPHWSLPLIALVTGSTVGVRTESHLSKRAVPLCHHSTVLQ